MPYFLKESTFIISFKVHHVLIYRQFSRKLQKSLLGVNVQFKHIIYRTKVEIRAK
jgi:hypothetical protein